MGDILISWDGPYDLDTIKEKNSDNDYGVYQIYGHHPVYGNDVLLYIGKAERQTFGKRISQEISWLYNSDSNNVEIYIGKLFGESHPTPEEWNSQIDIAERILIYTHWPAGNSSNINSITSNTEFLKEIKRFTVVNYDNYRSLNSVISAQHELNELEWFDEEHSYYSVKN
ncbi:hypothetical protein [Thiomicrorhabdus indica]|uniref:hypothetical protein n=1 Tax=Thiomicrorhabdus indica TaxID=2267253 RepID=UPI00102DB1D7|nr:hypothetical protein [Thiomicrorhabdus indica]